MWMTLLIGTVFAFLGFRLGKAKAYRELGPTVREAYTLGVDDGKKQVTEGGYREPAALPPPPPPPPPRSPLDERLLRFAQMIASSGMWINENNRADWERKHGK